MKWLITLILIIGFLPLVAATEDAIMTFQPDQNITLSTMCYLTNGSLCRSTAVCNSTIYNPNWTMILKNKPFSFKGDGMFQQNLSQFNTTGDYKVLTTCKVGTYYGQSRNDFRISGDTQKNILGGFNMIGAILIPLFLAILMIIGSITLDKEHQFFKTVLFIGSFIPIGMAVYLGMIATSDSNLKLALANFVRQYWWIMIIIVGYFLLYLVYKVFKGVSEQKLGKYKY